MKTILEIFYLHIVGKSVRYQRKEADLSRKGGDPDRIIRSLIREKRSAISSLAEYHSDPSPRVAASFLLSNPGQHPITENLPVRLTIKDSNSYAFAPKEAPWQENE